MNKAERWMRYGILPLVIYAVFRAMVTAAGKPFWYDELFTWAMAQQPDFTTLWDALLHGGDSMPPVFEWIEHAFIGLPAPEIAMRLPSILGSACVLICLFVFVRRRTDAWYGLVAVGLALLTKLYVPFAVEARAYSLLAACVAVALVAYQRAPARGWVALMAGALALGQSLHYYAIFALVPFIAAEAFHTWQTAKPRYGVWLALAIGAAPLAIFWPLLEHFKMLYGDTFWARPTLDTLYDAYGDLLLVPSAWGLAAAIVCGFSVIGALSWIRAGIPGSGPASDDSVPLHERVLVFMLLASPAIVFAAAFVMHGAFSARYVYYAVMGVPLAVGLVLPRIGRPAAILFCALLVVALALQEFSFWLSPDQPPGRLVSPAVGFEALLERASHPELPVVVSDPHRYFAVSHYASQALARRLYWIADADASLRYTGADTDDRTLPLLARYFPLQVDELAHFAAEHPAYLLYSNAPDALSSSADWWPQRLLQDGYDVKALAAEGGSFVFLVTAAHSRGTN